MTSNKAFEYLYGFYLYMHHHNVTLHEMYDSIKEEWEKLGKDLEILEILKELFEKGLLWLHKTRSKEHYDYYITGLDWKEITMNENQYIKIEEWLGK